MLAGGINPTGTITFTLYLGATLVDTETTTVNGNASYSTPTGYTLPATGTVTGTYQWDVSYSGDANNTAASDTNSANEQVAVSAASPTIVSTASSNVTLATAAPTVSDTAVFAGGYHPGGTIVFTLAGPGGFSYTQTDTVSGNASYTASDTLPTSGTVAGTYTWSATYSGDSNNNTFTETGSAANGEQTTVSAAGPTLATTASGNVTLATAAPTLSDTAVLGGGYHPGGTIVFTLAGPGGFSYTQTDTVSGNGTYTASDTLPTSGTVAGIYTWSVTYNGDGNNNAFTETGSAANGEQTTVSAAGPTLATTASGNVTLATAAPTLSDTAVLAGGYHPGGTIVFTLAGPGGFSYTQTDTVSGNGTYPASDTLPTAGTVAGNYTWSVTYNGDGNNNAFTETGSAANGEQTTVSAASPSISSTPNVTTAVLGTSPLKLSDTAVVSGGYSPTGNIAFTLFYNGGSTPVDTETLAINGNGSYTTPAGLTLPSSSAGTGSYQWNVSYSGDFNNTAVSNDNATNERVSVGPVMSTTPSAAVVLGSGTKLTDSATLSGGSNPSGYLLFKLTAPGGSLVDEEIVAVNGNSTYSTPNGYLPSGSGTRAGTYQWTVSYSGDSSNTALQSGAESVSVNLATPTLTATPGATVALASSARLTDSATLAGGFNATGTITFKLMAPGGTTLETETATVSGNGTYSTPTGYLPSGTGTQVGTYTWTASYSGDGNNNPAVASGTETEKVSAASPALTTTPGGTIAVGSGKPLTDSATLAGGFNPGGAILFTLTAPNGTIVDSETAPVTGNGTYTTPNGYLPGAAAPTGIYQWTASYSGDANNTGASSASGAEAELFGTATPAIATTPSATSVTIGTSTVTLKDTAALTGGFNPTGTITFTLYLNGGTTPVDSETVTVTANGSYTTPTGYTLPATGTVVGTYQWDVSYSGDTQNSAANDANAVNEQVKVSAASPTITTTPSATAVTLAGTLVTLTDTAALSGGFGPSGKVTFTLYYNGGTTPVDTETVPVNGNGSYTTPVGYILPSSGTVTGTYQWDASYSGDSNNALVSDNNSTSEKVTVSASIPTLTATAGAAVILGRGAKLTDSVALAGGFNPSGYITFTLMAPGGATVDSEIIAVTGNATYKTPNGYLPRATGTYQWTASYSGDGNNKAPASASGTETASAATTPTLTTKPGGTVVVGGSTKLTDSATLAGGSGPTGTITFYLFAPGVTPNATHSNNLFAASVAVHGNGTYKTPSTGYTPSAAGTFQWIATYSGDFNNNPVTSAAASETVSLASPKLTNTPGGPVVVGTGKLTDKATLSGGFDHGGQILFTLTAPSGSIVDSEIVAVTAGTTTSSTPNGYSPTVPGFYQWTASYSGDSNNNPVTTAAASELATSSTAKTPTLTVKAGGTVVVNLGTALAASATLTGGTTPTGTITFYLFAPGATANATGSGSIYSSTVTTTGNGSYSSASGKTTGTAVPTVAGTYKWMAVYSGDANNNAASTTAVAELAIVQTPPAGQRFGRS